LNFRGALRTAEAAGAASPPYDLPNRSVLHDDAVFAIRGSRIISASWGADSE